MKVVLLFFLKYFVEFPPDRSLVVESPIKKVSILCRVSPR